MILGFVTYLKLSYLQFERIQAEHQNSVNLFKLSKKVHGENMSLLFLGQMVHQKIKNELKDSNTNNGCKNLNICIF